MPPRASLTSSFSVSDANNEVVCPLTNNDGSNCRKRCLGEKRYRSMQEHIRRAHPDHYIPKLPATEESFQLMVTTPPDQRPHQHQQQQHHLHHLPPQSAHLRRADQRDKDDRYRSSPATPRALDEPLPAAATAAVALAELQQHHHRLNNECNSEPDAYSDTDLHRPMHPSIELPPLRDHFKQEPIPPFQSPRPRERQRELLPSILGHSPPGRSSTLPPIQRRPPRPRKGSLTQSGRRPKHERTRSREFGRRSSVNERKALSAEPQTAAWVQGKRWEDLIEAATSATEVEDDRDLTPVPPSPSFRSFASVTSAPSAVKQHRSSMPPAFQPGSQSSYRPFPPLSYTASPLQKALTPPPFDPRSGPDTDLEPFPSVESSMDTGSVSGKSFHMPGASNSSPVQPSSRPMTSSYPPSSHPQQLQNHHQRRMQRLSNPTSFNKEPEIYCASCSRPWSIRDSYACTECICGVCRECVGIISGLQPARTPASLLNPTSSPGNGVGNGNLGGGPGRPGLSPRKGCPSCGAQGGRWKGFQLEFR